MTAVRRHILLIDDNDDQRSILANALRARGWTVETARNGKEGLSVAALCKPSIVLTELILPDVRGFEFARSLRRMVDSDVVVIALTRIPEQLHARALSSGFDYVQRKPIDLDTLHERLLHVKPVPRAS
jgi:DNA-binding response OmpR family regulator